MKSKKYIWIGIGILSLFLLFGLSGISAAVPTTVVSVSPSTQNVLKGQSFTINITIDPKVAIAGAQFDLSFNSSLVTANSITEGNLLKQGGASTYFSPGTIDNTAGTITGVAGAITTPGQTVSSPGVFATIQMTAKSVDGTSPLDLSNVIVGDINGNPVSVTVNDGSVTVGVSPTPTPSPSPTPTPSPSPTPTPTPTPTPGTTTVSIAPPAQTVSTGSPFTVNVTIDPHVSIAGAQFDLSFNPTLVSANSVTEGNLLKQGGASTYFYPGTIDNTAGTITGVAGAITTPGQTVSSPGVFATIHMTVKSVDGTSPLDLSNVIVGDINGNPVSVTLNDGSVTVGVSPTPTPTPSPSPTPTPSPSPTPTPTPTPTPGTTTVSITPPAQTVPESSPFTVNITVAPTVPIAGAQFDLSFNPSLVSANSVIEGNLLNQGGASTYFYPGTIDNTAGTITGVAGAITTPGQTVSSPGVFATIQMTAKSVDGTSPLDLSNVIVGDINGNPVSVTVNDGSVTVGVVGYFDTGAPPNPYPSISGTHIGTITPDNDITVNKMYTYPCPGTGGYTEYVRIYGNGIDESASWPGYGGDWYNITFPASFTLEAGKTYNYTIRTGSYPQIIHEHSKLVTGGTITCTSFVDANGKAYNDWIPAIRLE